MNLKNINEIFNVFKHNAKLVTVKELVSGHINDTYLIVTQKEPFFVLQRINHFVFKDVPALVKNKVKVTKHLEIKLNSNNNIRTLTYISTKKGKYYYKDIKGNYWNLMLYIKDCKSFEKATTKKVAFEAGKLFGNFLNATNDFDEGQLIEIIPNFHNMEFRFLEFNNALQKASKERLVLAKDQIEIIKSLKEEMLVLNKLKKQGKLPIRVTHNDTKISNTLFTKKNKGLCVIDLDTVMPGIIHYDFGDAIRSICSDASEDEKDLTKVTFNLRYYEAFTEGFLGEIQQNISNIEANYLAVSAKVMTFIMALRMLTDFLNNDIYYKTDYELHNLNRSKNQLKLIEEMNKNFGRMQLIVIKYLK